jgi:hypothetical protein
VTRIRDTILGVWEFLAGDDWATAIGVAVALGITALLDEGRTAWVVTPIAVAILLTTSIWREARKNGRR